MELTREHFDEVAKQLATKDDITELKQELATLRETVDSHTSFLDGIASDVKDWNTELVAVRARLDRHDQWFKQIADSLKLKLN